MDDIEAMSRLHELSAHLVGAAGLETILEEVCDVAIGLTEADFGNLQLTDAASSDLRIAVQRGFPSWWMDFWNREATGQGTCRSALKAGVRVIVDDVETSPLFMGKPALDMQLRAGVRAVQSTPLLTRTGQAVGVLSTHYRRPRRPDAHMLRWLDLLARQAADLIEHFQMTLALRNSELRCRALILATSDVVYSMSPDWSRMRVLDGKGFFCAPAGVRDDWLTRHIDPDEQPRVVEAIQQAIRTKSVFDLEHRVRRPDGTSGMAHSRAIPLLAPDGEVVEWFGTATDMTEARQTESELFEERQRLQALLQALPIGVAFTNSPTCEHVTGNAALLEQLDMGAQDNVSASAPDVEARGRQVLYFREGKLVAPLDLPLQRAAREGRTIEPQEYVVCLPGGRETTLEISGAPIRSASGDVIGAVTVSTDVTERKRAAEAQEQARLKDEFLAILGHELRNPLMAISNALDLLNNDVSTSQRDTTSELIRAQVGVLRRLVDDLLDMSRVTLDGIRLQKDGVSLMTLLSTAAAAARPAARQRSQELTSHLPGGEVNFLADRVRLQQILANLLDNASKYGGPGCRIELSGALEGTDVVLRCKDNGPGIPPELHARIFMPLVRMESARQDAPGGLGLGLALVRHLAELHGGSVCVNSQGMGSEFIVRIPFEKPPVPAEAALAPAPATRSARCLSVVLVEDNEDVAHILAFAIERAGHRVIRFSEGRAALAGLRNFTPDVVVVDAGLPGMNGFEVMARLRQDAHLAHTRFIGVSGLPYAEAAAEAGHTERAHFDHFLLKPIDIKEMLSLFGRAVPSRTALTTIE